MAQMPQSQLATIIIVGIEVLRRLVVSMSLLIRRNRPKKSEFGTAGQVGGGGGGGDGLVAGSSLRPDLPRVQAVDEPRGDARILQQPHEAVVVTEALENMIRDRFFEQLHQI